jgi:K(+)-stimulated pyrophosphate-energized sodium pump
MNELAGIPLAMGAGVLGLLFTGYLFLRIRRADPGTPEMRKISGAIHEGALAFLFREYRSIAVFAAVVSVLLYALFEPKTAFAFVVGAFCSVLSGFIGMQFATRANVRTACAAGVSFNEALGVAFAGGAAIGTCVVGLGLFGLSAVYLLFIALSSHASTAGRLTDSTMLLAGFSMGASSVALFARVGGGIYTKAADVGADLVGKVEAGIPEDDPRNPAVIADNVGDNVGDVAGMGADLFESYVGAVVSALIIAVTPNPAIDIRGAMLALLVAGWGVIASIAGVFFVRTTERSDPQTALRAGMVATAFLFVAGAFILIWRWYGSANLFFAVLSGLAAGVIMGFTAEYFTSGRTVREIASSAQTGAATCVIAGFASGMRSTAVPLLAIALAVIAAYALAGIFGVAFAALGMLAVTGMTVAVDAYGPIADNAAGIAEMAHMGPDARRRAERLDAVGNTTAAIGKGFAIGSAALTALALFTAYSQAAGLPFINILDATVVAGLFIGGAVPFVFSSYTMRAVGRAAFKIVEEVRRQFREIAGLMEGNAMPDSARCIDITTRAALREMVIPSVMAAALPLLIGVFLGTAALGGFLVGSLITGVPLALLLANSGGAWDNAKKYIEEGNFGGKGSDAHKAAVIGDTIGDPFKDRVPFKMRHHAGVPGLRRFQEARSAACPLRHVSDERRRNRPKSALPEGAAGLLPHSCVASSVTDRCGYAPSSRLALGQNPRGRRDASF